MKVKHCLAAALAVTILLAPGETFALTFAKAYDNIAYLPVHQMGYTGKDVIIGIIDMDTINKNHVTFYTSSDCTTSRVTTYNYGGDPGIGIGHAHVVAGIAAGRGPGDGTYLGVAPEALVWGASCSSNQIAQAFWDFTQPDCVGKRCYVLNMSLADSTTTPDGEDPFVKYMDWLGSERNALISFGAGNGSTIWLPGDNYNQLTVGGLDQALQHPVLSHGPTADGRTKPDVVAPASSIYIPFGADDDWGNTKGSFTSHSAPFGAGVAALLEQYGDEHGIPWDSRLAKSAILNSAVKLEGWTHTELHPLDNAQGAGRINALRAIQQYSAGWHPAGDVPICGWDLDNINNLAPKFYHMTDVVPAGSYITSTLNWYRYTGVNENDEWVTFKFENLDLLLHRGSDNVVVARSVSTVDSLEHIYYQVPQADTYTLEVQLLGTGFREDTYALTWYTDVPEPATLTLLVVGLSASALLRRRRVFSAHR